MPPVIGKWDGSSFISIWRGLCSAGTPNPGPGILPWYPAPAAWREGCGKPGPARRLGRAADGTRRCFRIRSAGAGWSRRHGCFGPLRKFVTLFSIRTLVARGGTHRREGIPGILRGGLEGLPEELRMVFLGDGSTGGRRSPPHAQARGFGQRVLIFLLILILIPTLSSPVVMRED